MPSLPLTNSQGERLCVKARIRVSDCVCVRKREAFPLRALWKTANTSKDSSMIPSMISARRHEV